MFARWTFDPWLVTGIAIAALLYARGTRGLVGRTGFPAWRPCCFGLGLLVIFVALASPIDPLGHLLLSVHMVQHWLLLMVAAPLLLLGAPGIPVLRGLPRVVRREALGPFLASPGIRRAFSFLVHPVTGVVAFTLATWVWHAPRLYQWALESTVVHRLEHATFLAGAMLLWWPIIAPWPWRRRWHEIALVACLLAADLQGTIFSAILTFSRSVLYPSYAATSPAAGFDPLRDQHTAGAFMWTAGQVVILPTVAWLVLRALKGQRRPARGPVVVEGLSAVEGARILRAGLRRGVRQNLQFDLLRVRVIGAALRRPAIRNAIRWLLVACAALVALDGFLGPDDAPSNLAGTLPWTHWRGLIVIALLATGNLLCMACPLMAPRRLMRKFVVPKWRWPEALKSKWLAAGLVVLWLVAYEAFDLWASPLATAWVIVGYFVAILLVDALFKGASFCKWVCPIGQLHMATSLVSPLSVGVRDMRVCATCTTHECIKGVEISVRGMALRGGGCELELFQPMKRGNLDCTFCLDCVDVCPHSNVGIVAQQQRRGLADGRWGSSIGRITNRLDVSVLVGVLTFGAFANALGMTASWLALVDEMVARGWAMWVAEGALAVSAIVVVPAALVVGAGWAASAKAGPSLRESICRGLHALVPLGAAMWAAHWIFHLSTGWSTGLPVLQRAAQDLGLMWFGEPEWAASCCGPIPGWLKPLELLLLQAGLLMSAWMAWRSLGVEAARGVRSAAPWWVVALCLYAVGCWIVLEPMQMRGTAMP